MNTTQIDAWGNSLTAMLQNYGMKVLGAIAALLVGLWLIKLITKAFGKGLEKKKLDESLRAFFVSMFNALLKTLLVISVLSMLGIEVTSFIAILGAAGLAIGMALSGALQNFAGGVLILVFRPFKVGDLIEAQGHLGVVKEVQIFVTILLTPDNKTVIIPNGPLSGNDVTNYSTEGLIRVDLLMGIAYGADLKAAKEALMAVMNAHTKVLSSPEPFVGVFELADSAVNLAVRPYCKPEDYWDVYFDVYEQGKLALDKANVEIPFPQVDVHMKEAHPAS